MDLANPVRRLQQVLHGEFDGVHVVHAKLGVDRTVDVLQCNLLAEASRVLRNGVVLDPSQCDGQDGCPFTGCGPWHT
eukprot:565579-Rhodomonas_salina.1